MRARIPTCSFDLSLFRTFDGLIGSCLAAGLSVCRLDHRVGSMIIRGAGPEASSDAELTAALQPRPKLSNTCWDPIL